MLGAWYIQLKYGQTISDSSWNIQLEDQKLLHAKRLKEIRASTVKELPASEPPQPENSIPFGDKWLEIEKTESHFLILGVPGAGKTLLTYYILSHVLKLTNRRVVIFDPKNDVRGILHAMDISYLYFNISSKNGLRWAVERDFTSYNLRQFASILLPEEQNGGDSFWLEAARALVVGVICVFIYLEVDWKFHDILKATQLSKDELVKFLGQFPGNTALVNALFSEEVEKTAGNVQLDLFVKLQRLVAPAVHSQQATRDFSLAEFMKSEGVLVIGMDLSEREASTPMIRAVFRRLTDLINAQEEKPKIKTFLFIEESYFLGKLPGLDELITFSRSKNAIVFIILQGIEGFYELFQKNVAELILGFCRYIIALRSTPATAKWLSSLFGQIKKFKRKKNDGFSQGGATGGDQVGEESEAKFLDSAFLSIPIPSREKGGLTGYFITPDGAEKRTIAGETVEQMKPKRVVIPSEPKLDAKDQVLLPWTPSEKQKFVYGETKGGGDVNTLNDFLDKEIAEYLVEFARKFVEEFKNGKEECN